MQFPEPIPQSPGPPASASPMADYLQSGPPALTHDGRYVVLPTRLLEDMALPWQQRCRPLLDDFGRTYANAPWPIYRVIPMRWMQLTDCSEEQLAEVDVIAEYDGDELVYRDRKTLQRIESPEQRSVQVSCEDRFNRS